MGVLHRLPKKKFSKNKFRGSLTPSKKIEKKNLGVSLTNNQPLIKFREESHTPKTILKK